MIHWIVQFTMCITSRCILHRAPNQHINRYRVCSVHFVMMRNTQIKHLLGLRLHGRNLTGSPYRFPTARRRLFMRLPRIPMSGTYHWGGLNMNARIRCGYTNDPSAGSPTETLLRLLLPLSDKVYTTLYCNARGPTIAQVWIIYRITRSVGATGGVYKGQGRNQRELMTHTY